MSKIYYQERNHPNWHGRVPRQSRITGEYSASKRTSIGWDIVAVTIGAIALISALWL